VKRLELARNCGVIGGVRIAMVLILGAATSCATHSPEVADPVAVEPRVHSPQASEEPPEPALECLPEGFVARAPTIPTYAAEPSDGTCRAIAKSLRKQLSEQLRADWYYVYAKSRLDVDFGCDRLGDIEEITLQYGSGHGGTLDLARLRASADGPEWEVLLLRHSGGYYPEPGERGAGVHRGRVSADEVTRVLEGSRAALMLEAKELTEEKSISSASSSSGDFHAFVRLVDDHDQARAVGFSGYPGSDEQLAWRIPSLAVWPLAELIDAAQLQPATPDADSQTFFMERFAETEAADYYGELGSWWVHERLLEMAGLQATLDLLPTLALRLCPSPDGPNRVPGAALASMLALLGRDEALLLDERERLNSDQAARWIAACEVSCLSVE
jgi:hypothetical protein